MKKRLAYLILKCYTQGVTAEEYMEFQNLKKRIKS